MGSIVTRPGVRLEVCEMKLKAGDKVWVVLKDGACQSGWYVFNPHHKYGPIWQHEHGSVSNSITVGCLKISLAVNSRRSKYFHMAEQLIADGSM